MDQKNVLQRYMDLPKFMCLLQKKSLFLSKMSKFDDHLEGGLTAIDYLSSSNGGAHLDIGLNGTGDSCAEVNKEVNQRKFKTPFGEYYCNNLDEIFPRCREWLYVSCWHKSLYESSAMWSLYGGVNNSVCIFTTKDKLLNQIVKPEETIEIKLQDVEYINHSSESLSDGSLAPFLAKSLPFSFEQESRLIAYNSTVDLKFALDNHNNGIDVLIKSLPQLIDKVVISPKADVWFSESIKLLCQSYGLNVVEDSALCTKRIDGFLEAFQKLEQNGL